jgi:hypothetical protein
MCVGRRSVRSVSGNDDLVECSVELSIAAADEPVAAPSSLSLPLPARGSLRLLAQPRAIFDLDCAQGIVGTASNACAITA